MHFAPLPLICSSNGFGALLWSRRLIDGLAAADYEGRTIAPRMPPAADPDP